jgi:hypothetical protein
MMRRPFSLTAIPVLAAALLVRITLAMPALSFPDDGPVFGIICHPAEAPHPAGPEPPPTHSGDCGACSLCSVPGAWTLLPVAAGTLPAPIYRRIALRSAAIRRLAANRLLGIAQPRGPPARA